MMAHVQDDEHAEIDIVRDSPTHNISNRYSVKSSLIVSRSSPTLQPEAISLPPQAVRASSPARLERFFTEPIDVETHRHKLNDDTNAQTSQNDMLSARRQPMSLSPLHASIQPHSLPALSRSATATPALSSAPLHQTDAFVRPLLYLILALVAVLVIFSVEYVIEDQKHHSLMQSDLDVQTAMAKEALGRLTENERKMGAINNKLNGKEIKISQLTKALTHREDMLSQYAQIITDLQHKTAQSDAELADRLNFAQSLVNSTHSLMATVETITRVIDSSDDAAPLGGSGTNDLVAGVAVKLVDANKNEYILSSPSEHGKTVDARLILDLGTVICTSALSGLLASLIHQPVLLGYLLGGSLIGPGGLKLIGQFVQVETLAEFGATFLLFALGVEFSLSKLSRVRGIAFMGGFMQMGGIIACVVILGLYLYGWTGSRAVFVGCVLSMSSTTVVVKSLMEKKEINGTSGQVMLGLLIVQDLFLSLILALLPLSHSSSQHHVAFDILWLLCKFILLGTIVVVCMYVWPATLRLLDGSNSHDLFLLGLVALCVLLTVVSEHIIGSAEVGAFLSGLLISSSPTASNALTRRSLKLFAPIRDMFGALFFSSMGMLINPSFLLEHWFSVLTMVAVTLVIKSIVTTVTVRTFNLSLSHSIHIGLCLSQVGEFAFILASQGLRENLIDRELYMMLLGTTAVTIFLTPSIMAVAEVIRKTMDNAAAMNNDVNGHGVTTFAINGESDDTHAMSIPEDDADLHHGKPIDSSTDDDGESDKLLVKDNSEHNLQRQANGTTQQIQLPQISPTDKMKRTS